MEQLKNIEQPKLELPKTTQILNIVKDLSDLIEISIEKIITEGNIDNASDSARQIEEIRRFQTSLLQLVPIGIDENN
jgi:copper homeostasis protein CutC